MRDDERQEPLADLPCDAPGCNKPWKYRINANGEPIYYCAEHFSERYWTKGEVRG